MHKNAEKFSKISSVTQYSTEQRLGIVVTGVVQGVGFRPFVYNLAKNFRLNGFVRNEGGAVRIEVEGGRTEIEGFVRVLKCNAPPLARISNIAFYEMEATGEPVFSILESAVAEQSANYVPADAATCSDCIAELFDPLNRRFRYPFINCTNCGPRFTIIEKLPYDRPFTTMSAFKMCQACKFEYDNPSNRRFHAQPNACSDCGPSIRFFDSASSRMAGKTLDNEIALNGLLASLKQGQIAAVKGLGGFHLVCSAENEESIARLRARKRRAAKAFALMMANIEMVHSYCELSSQEEHILLSRHRPILLLKRRNNLLPGNLAPDSDSLGVMLPYTPLHHLILADYGAPIVATSANLSEEPIAIDNEEALSRLGQIADCFLDNDRKIYSRYDDSVLQMVSDGSMFLRRSRGYAPDALSMPFRSQRTVLALGPQLKNTFAIVRENQAFLSQHIGDLDNLETAEHLQQSINTYLKLFDLVPDLIAYDLHPDYFTSSLASELSARWKLPAIQVQHHHAHIVSCMAEHNLRDSVLGVAFDGIGYGADQTLWGGEFLLCQYDRFERLAHLETFQLPGGTQAIREPWRIALAFVEAAPADRQGAFAPFIQSLEEEYGERSIAIVKQQIGRRLNSPSTSSCGRLFDAISALTGVCHQADYEGQAAIRFQKKASNCSHSTLNDCMGSFYSFSLTDAQPVKIKIIDVVSEAYGDLRRGERVEDISCRFHSTMAQIICQTCIFLRDKTKVNLVCLSGGVFQNELLLEMSKVLLEENGFQAYRPQQIPPNDGGISLGQAVVALAKTGSLVF